MNIKEQAIKENDFLDMLKSNSEFSIQKALSNVNGSVSTYERIVRLSARLLPENISRLNYLIDNSLSNYAIEIHGLKSVLNNIGAYELGEKALELEKLSKSGEIDKCKTLHKEFTNRLKDFSNSLNTIANKTNIQVKTKGDKILLLEALSDIEKASEFFDSVQALEIILSIDKHTYGQLIDKMISTLIQAFECFDFDKAIELINQLKDELD